MFGKLFNLIYKSLWIINYKILNKKNIVIIIRNSFDYALLKEILPYIKNYEFLAINSNAAKYLREINQKYRQNILFPSIVVTTVFLECETNEDNSFYYNIFFKKIFLNKLIKRIQIYHGVLDKNYTYEKYNLNYELLLVPGAYAFNRLVKHGIPQKRIKIVGFPKLDNIKIEKILKKNTKKVILYAPTWGAISSLPIMFKKLITLRSKYNLIVKTHYLTPWYYIDVLKLLDINVSNDPNVTNLFADADLLISDSSSVMFEFLITNKPILVIDTFTWLRDRITLNSKNGPEIKFRNIFERISDLDKLEEIIHKLLNTPVQNEVERKKVFNYLFEKPGESGRRAASEINKLIN
jgi:CDP-glycerol glycerophosphotransferase (TagB/SpsB family)